MCTEVLYLIPQTQDITLRGFQAFQEAVSVLHSQWSAAKSHLPAGYAMVTVLVGVRDVTARLATQDRAVLSLSCVVGVMMRIVCCVEQEQV